MKFITLFIIFVVFYCLFDWIIKKTDIHNKLFNKYRMKKYIRIILILVLIFFAFSIEYGKQLMKDMYGHYNYISIIIGAFMSSIYMNFVPIMFRSNK
jgi:hypothetical protein